MGIPHFKYEELLMDLFNINDHDYEETDFDELVFKKLGISLEQFKKVVDLLIARTMGITSSLTNRTYQGFCNKDSTMFVINKLKEDGE